MEATFRRKRNEDHVGYVTNVTETADPDNDLQLILKVQTESNTTDDAKMLANALPGLVERTELDTMHSDGGYNSTEMDNVCRDFHIDLVQTAIRGGQPSGEGVNLADFTFAIDENGEPEQITCPGGQTVDVEAGRNPERYKAAFMQLDCTACDFLNKCQLNELKRQPKRMLYFTLAQMDIARRRQLMKQAEKSGCNLRAAVEATVREISCRLESGNLRVRGKFRVEMTMLASAAMTNARRIWRYQQAQETTRRKQLATQNGEQPCLSAKKYSGQNLIDATKSSISDFERQILTILGGRTTIFA